MKSNSKICLHQTANNFEDLMVKIKEIKPQRILLQAPEGLKTKVVEISEQLKKRTGCEVIIYANPCYGACDLPIKEAELAECDLILHYGHAKFYRHIETKIPVIYYLHQQEMSLNLDKISHEVAKINERRIGLVSSVQFLKVLDKVKEILEKQGKQVTMGGAILGCWHENVDKLNSKVDAWMFVGSGNFHPLAFNCKYVLDLERNELRLLKSEIEKFERQRFARIAKAAEARSFGILVTSKLGQHELLGSEEKIKKRLEKFDRKASVIILDEIINSKLVGIKVDAFINTACPRIADDHFDKPLLNASDLDDLEKIWKNLL